MKYTVDKCTLHFHFKLIWYLYIYIYTSCGNLVQHDIMSPRYFSAVSMGFADLAKSNGFVYQQYTNSYCSLFGTETCNI